VNGKRSGPRWHWLLRLTRHTWLTSGSTSRAISPASLPKIDTCWPYGESMIARTGVSRSSNACTGTTGPNCSSCQARIEASTPARTAGA